MYKLDPSEVKDLFVFHDNALHKRLSLGRIKEVTSVEGGQLVTMVRGEVIPAVAIMWALQYGRWPSFQLVLLSRDPRDVHISNIYPARLRRYRFRMSGSDGAYKHPLLDERFPTPEACYRSWERCARSLYQADLPTVLHLEHQQQLQREATIAANPHLAPKLRVKRPVKENVFRPRKPRRSIEEGGRPPKPARIEGREWYWYEGEWLNVPEAVHVSDDWKVRCAAVKAGATVAHYDAELQQTVYS